VRRLPLLTFALAALLTAQDPRAWTKLVAADQSYSLHYPPGWTAKHDPGTLRLNNPSTDEEILLLRMPRLPSKATAHAEAVAAAFQTGTNFQMTNLTGAGDSAVCRIAYSIGGKDRSGLCAVVLKTRTAW